MNFPTAQLKDQWQDPQALLELHRDGHYPCAQVHPEAFHVQSLKAQPKATIRDTEFMEGALRGRWGALVSPPHQHGGPERRTLFTTRRNQRTGVSRALLFLQKSQAAGPSSHWRHG